METAALPLRMITGISDTFFYMRRIMAPHFPAPDNLQG